MNVKQIIIARKDLAISPGKLAAQVSHASQAFVMEKIKENIERVEFAKYPADCDYKKGFDKWLTKYAKEAKVKGLSEFSLIDKYPDDGTIYGLEDRFVVSEPGKYTYNSTIELSPEIVEGWIMDEYAKVVLAAKNKSQLLKAKTRAIENGLVEGKDFFLIYDNCHTELNPEEDGKTLTCIGFAPMKSEKIDLIGKHYQLYK